MNFHLKNLDGPGTPEVWGMPRLSPHLGQWVLDWFNAGGIIEGVTMPTPEQVAWIKANPAKVASGRQDFAKWEATKQAEAETLGRRRR